MAKKRSKYYGTHDIYSAPIRKAFYIIKGNEKMANHHDTHSQLYVVIRCSGRKDGDSILRSAGLLAEGRNLLNYNNSCETGNARNIATCDKSTIGIAISPLHDPGEMLTWEEIKEYLDKNNVQY